MGAIAPGYLADLVVLDRDCFTVPEDQIGLLLPAHGHGRKGGVRRAGLWCALTGAIRNPSSLVTRQIFRQLLRG
jgi:cytosine/adenosine deaminase-related metal-dependent hydrolase